MALFKKAEQLSDVRERIHEILAYCRKQKSPLGYFAALYTTVAKAIEDSILNKEYDDNEQLARMDVNFVNYYIHAMNCAFSDQAAPAHWQVAIDAAKKSDYLVLEHLFVAMNAHINYDLSNAANDTVPAERMLDFRQDFFRVNNILFSLLDRVQTDVSFIFHPLKLYLRFGRQLDDKIIALIMGRMRGNAYEYTCVLALCNEAQKEQVNQEQMEQVVKLSQKIIFHSNWLINAIIRLARLLERGTVAYKIDQLLK